MDPLFAAIEVGKFDPIRRLGAGGMGIVVLARHRELGSLHAIKVLHDGHPDVDVRLRQEGRLQATLVHPNVVRVTDTVDVAGRAGLVMEFIDGPTLGDLLGSRTLSLPEVDRIARGILRGVAAAHERGWIHRDLKPSNILIQITDGELIPKVTDFGLAKVHDDGPGGDPQAGTTTRLGVGTRCYMPFEQLIGLPPDPRIDVFALGAILYELVSGRQAFPTVESWDAAIRSDTYPDPDRDDLPGRMRAAVRRSLAATSERVGNARELLVLWNGTEPESTSAFSSETLETARVAGRHLRGERLVSQEPSDEERAHLAECARCRMDAVRMREYVRVTGESSVGATTPPVSTLPSVLASRERPRARIGWRVAVPATLLVLAAGWGLYAATPATPKEPALPTALPEARGPSVPIAPPPPSRTDPEPVTPRPTAVAKETGSLVVNTRGGPAGRFRVDRGPTLAAGVLRKQTLTVGTHRVRVFAATGETPVWEGDVAIVPAQQTVLCWDLAAGARCRE